MAGKTFTLFHLSLMEVRQLDIETRRGLTREGWLRLALKDAFRFEHWGGGQIVWVPKEDIDGIIFGVLQRTRAHGRHAPPELGGNEEVVEEWQGAYVLLDPTHHDEGQRVSVENDVVGDPKALLKSLVESINDRVDAPYHIEVEPLFDSNRFWAFAAANNNILKSVTFDFVVPNMWGTESELEADLKRTGVQTGAERVRVDIRSKNGISTDNDTIRDGVDYSERGAGTVRAMSMTGKRFRAFSH